MNIQLIDLRAGFWRNRMESTGPASGPVTQGCKGTIRRIGRYGTFRARIMKLRRAYRLVKRACRCAAGRAVRVKLARGIRTERHGSEYGGWELCPDSISCSSVIYSIGVGEDITFDESLIGAYGVTVHAFDPTPSVIDWVSGAVLPKSFAFHPYGVADFDGTAEFFPPQNQSYVSHSMVQNTGRDGIRVPVRRMATIMRELGHQKIDVLKMDIEGAEYAVIDDIVREGISIGQFLVEFHDRFASVGIGSTRAAIEKLEGIGFVPIANGESGDEFTFIHLSQLQRLRTL